jgi:poly-gamma-glutamate capsule biosynthesis protein CapA/YwtB (metallophosphatase superfamily)
MYEAESGQFSLGLVGDCLLTRRLAVFREERFLRLREILTQTDVTFGNFESNVQRYLDAPHAQRPGGGTYVTTEPALLDDLRWLGIELVAASSNHADDYGWEGIRETMRALTAAGLVQAGLGRHLAEARAPAFLDTARGRVGLVAATATYNARARAGEQRRDAPGHPGVNGMRWRTIYEVDDATLADLRRVGRAIGLDRHRERRRNLGDAAVAADEDDAYEFLGQRFVRGPRCAVRTEADTSDVEENLRQVRAARAMADRVIASLHCHELGGPTLLTADKRSDVEDLADFAVDYARRSIDAGADVFVAHGPQVPLGIELYRGRPIFYSLGAFIFEIETQRFLPEEAYERYGLGERATPADFLARRYADDTRGHTGDPAFWRQICAVCDYTAAGLKQIRLYPVELGYGKPRTQRGRPLLAEAAVGEAIIERVARLSRRYGTEVVYRDGIGVIEVQ